jgi:hypothetical protein
MNNAQAKFVLRSYRADGSDARDPAFREALAQADRDPSLARWLAEEMALDQALAERLNATPAPAGLVDDLLALQRIRVLPSRRAHRTAWFALAAAAMLAVSLTAWWLHTPPLSIGAYARAATGFLNRPFELEVKAESLTDVQAWLLEHKGSSAVSVPAALASASEGDVGCRSFSWRGQEVVLLCFTLENGVQAHLFVMDRTSLPDAADVRAVQFAQQGKWSTATWAEGNQAFVLATLGGNQALEALL